MTELLTDFNVVAGYFVWTLVYILIATNVIGTIAVLTLAIYAHFCDDDHTRRHIYRTLIKLRNKWR